MVMGHAELFTYRSLDRVQPRWMLPESFSTPLFLVDSKGYKLKDLFLLSSKLVTSAGKSYCPCDPGQGWGQRSAVCLPQSSCSADWLKHTDESSSGTCFVVDSVAVFFLLICLKMLVQPSLLSSNVVEGWRNKNGIGMFLDPNWQEEKCKNKWHLSSICLWEIPT